MALLTGRYAEHQLSIPVIYLHHSNPSWERTLVGKFYYPYHGNLQVSFLQTIFRLTVCIVHTN